jgi:hypothetical protein
MDKTATKTRTQAVFVAAIVLSLVALAIVVSIEFRKT